MDVIGAFFGWSVNVGVSQCLRPRTKVYRVSESHQDPTQSSTLVVMESPVGDRDFRKGCVVPHVCRRTQHLGNIAPVCRTAAHKTVRSKHRRYSKRFLYFVLLDSNPRIAHGVRVQKHCCCAGDNFCHRCMAVSKLQRCQVTRDSEEAAYPHVRTTEVVKDQTMQLQVQQLQSAVLLLQIQAGLNHSPRD